MGNEMSNAPQHALPLIRTFMDLIGAEGAKSPTTPTSGTHSNLHVPSQPVQQQQYQPSPMSVHAIVDWENTESAMPPPPPQPPQPQPQPQPPSQEPFVPNNVSTAAWQQLFSSAATPFFESEFDWQSKSLRMGDWDF